LRLVSHYVWTKLPVGPHLVTFMTELLRDIQHDYHGQNVKFASESYQGFPSFRLNVRRIDNRQTASSKPLTRNVMQHIECIICGRLSILVIRDKSATEIGRENFCRLKVLLRERRFPATGGTYQHNERQLWNRDLHRLNTPI
jgi:hypothetical protein